ncbi:MAG: HIT family protein [Casimicrobium sp.]
MADKSHQESCLFCRIAARQVGAHVVYESEQIVAFLDVNPIRIGHTQIIPIRHFDCFDALPETIAAEIISVGQRLARAIKIACDVPRVAFLFTGGDIAHAHAHVVPMVEFDDITSRRYIVEEQVTCRDAPRALESDLASCAALIQTHMSLP